MKIKSSSFTTEEKETIRIMAAGYPEIYSAMELFSFKPKSLKEKQKRREAKRICNKALTLYLEKKRKEKERIHISQLSYNMSNFITKSISKLVNGEKVDHIYMKNFFTRVHVSIFINTKNSIEITKEYLSYFGIPKPNKRFVVSL